LRLSWCDLQLTKVPVRLVADPEADTARCGGALEII